MSHLKHKSSPTRILLCLSLLAFTGVTASAATTINDAKVTAAATASKNTIGVADPFNVTIEAIASEGFSVRFAEFGDQVGDFEIVSLGDTIDVPLAEGRKYQRQLTLETLKTGKLIVPAFEVFFENNETKNADDALASVKTASIPITVQTAITSTDNPSQFRDIKHVVFIDEPTTANSTPWNVIAIFGGLGIAGTMGLVVLNRFWKQLSPQQRALQALDQLCESGLLANSDSKFVYEETTQILRTFIESQFDFPATRQTTEEFLAAVNADRRLAQPLQQRLKQFLESADIVKFAGLCCSETVLAEAVDQARQFVLQSDQQRIAAAELARIKSPTKQQPHNNNAIVVPTSERMPAKDQSLNINHSSLQKETV